MYHIASFKHERTAERVAGRMELMQIRTGLRDDHMASGESVFNLFVNDRQVEDAFRVLPDIFATEHADEDTLVCPGCGSHDVHPISADELGLPMRDKVRRQEPLHLRCRKCNCMWE